MGRRAGAGQREEGVSQQANEPTSLNTGEETKTEPEVQNLNQLEVWNVLKEFIQEYRALIGFVYFTIVIIFKCTIQ